MAVVVETLVDGLEDEERLDTPTASSNATISTGASTRKTVATPASTTGTAIPSPQVAPPLAPSAYTAPKTPPHVIADDLLVEGTAQSSWEDAVAGLAFDQNRSPRAGEQMLALLRASHSLVHM